MTLKAFLYRACVTMLKISYKVINLFASSGERITYISRQADEPSEDMMLLVDVMKKSHPEFRNVVLAKKIKGPGYFFHFFRQMHHIARSRLVVLDGYCIVASTLNHNSNTEFIQMWHASAAVKKFGYQTLDKESGSTRRIAGIMKMHHNYNWVFAPSKATGRHFSEAFDVNISKIRYLGLPHLDLLLQPLGEKQEKIDSEYPGLAGKKNILYIPTFRKNKEIPLSELTEVIDYTTYNLIVKLHPMDNTKSTDSRVITDQKFSTYDWMRYCDIIITDYSSLAVEAAILLKPLFLWVYDIDEYRKDPGLNIDPEGEAISEFAAKKARKLKTMLSQIETYDIGALKEFRDKYIEIEPGKCREDMLKFIEGIISDGKDNRKRN